MDKGFPKTYQPPGDSDPGTAGAKRPQVFDPALKQYPRAFRQGDPLFEREGVARAWQRARRLAIDHVLRAVADSPWKDHLVLRGSVVLRAWFGEQAREPGDLDFVVVPMSIKLTDPWAAELFSALPAHLARRIPAGAIVGGVEVLAAESAADDIWTYDRAPAAGSSSPGEPPACPSARSNSTSSSAKNSPPRRSRRPSRRPTATP